MMLRFVQVLAVGVLAASLGLEIKLAQWVLMGQPRPALVLGLATLGIVAAWMAVAAYLWAVKFLAEERGRRRGR